MVVRLRAPVAAGTFYDINPDNLRRQLDSCFRDVTVKSTKRRVLASIVPHSAYANSGSVAAHSFANMGKSNFIILGSNHSALGSDFALMKNSLWKTPIGEIVVDDKFADDVIKDSKLVEYDAIPHTDEFSVEVQLPFMLYKFGSLKILPIVVKNQVPDQMLLENCKLVGKSIAKMARKTKWKVIASSDFTQTGQKEKTEQIDKQLIKSIVKLDAKEFFERVGGLNARVCGYGAIATVIYAAKEMGAKKAELLRYDMSSDVEGIATTGYASIIFY